MSGKKGMKHYSAEAVTELEALKASGMCHREIGERMGLTQSQVKEFFARKRRRERAIENGYVPKSKGRPRKRPITAQERILELEREVELLKAFLHVAGRR